VPSVPRETFSHTATSTASRDEAWGSLNRPSTWEGIGGVERVFDPFIDDEGRLRRFSFETLIGGRSYRGKATPHERVDGSAMSWYVDSPEVSGVIAVDLQDAASGTLVRVDLEVESAGVLSALFFPVIARALSSGFTAAVDEFAARLGAEV
jgi:hypothetical protein